NPIADDPKKALELRKLALEIADLERRWWQRPVYILSALPTLLAIFALSVGFLNGFFSAQLTKLDNQKHDLEGEIREFERTRDDLRAQIEKARADLAVKEVSLSRIKPIVSKLQSAAFGQLSECLSPEPDRTKFKEGFSKLTTAIRELQTEIRNDEEATR